MFCPQCGTPDTPEGRFCGNCGTRLPIAALAGSTPAGAVDVQRPEPSRAGAGPAGRWLDAPTLTVAVVACVVTFSLMFVVTSAAMRALGGDAPRRDLAQTSRASGAPQGALGSLLSPPRMQRAEPRPVR